MICCYCSASLSLWFSVLPAHRASGTLQLLLTGAARPPRFTAKMISPFLISVLKVHSSSPHISLSSFVSPIPPPWSHLAPSSFISPLSQPDLFFFFFSLFPYVTGKSSSASSSWLQSEGLLSSAHPEESLCYLFPPSGRSSWCQQHCSTIKSETANMPQS